MPAICPHTLFNLKHGRMNYKDTKPYMSAFLLKLTYYQTLRHCV
jgi:hypothetical protein